MEELQPNESLEERQANLKLFQLVMSPSADAKRGIKRLSGQGD